MIILQDYWMGRDRIYGAELTEDRIQNATITVARINTLIAAMKCDGVEIENHPQNKTPISSGWRPAKVNANVAGAALRSKHISCQAIDLYDPDGDIDNWAYGNPHVLKQIGLWQEHPSATKGWAHFQTVAPRSGNRVFYP